MKYTHTLKAGLAAALLTLPTHAENIDVMVVYTNNVAQSNGGASGVRAAINAAVATSNDAFQRSGLNTRLRLVHTQGVEYDEGSPSQDLRALRSTSDGKMDEVHRLRNEKGADLVALIADSARWGNVAGIGYIGNGNNSRSGFSATGYRFTSSGGTFAHEIGHNLGCGHDQDNGGGLFNDSHGWRFDDSRGRLRRTVMAYFPGRRTSHFSNPDIFFDGAATGVASEADNVRTIERTQRGTSNYRDEVTDGGGGTNPPPPPTPPTPPPVAKPIDPDIKRIFENPTGDADAVNTWMGELKDIDFPSVNHQFIGNMRLWSRSSSRRLYFNSNDLGGWVYTRRGLYPNIYRFSTREWLRYEVGSQNPRVFYNYRTGQNETF